MGFRNRLAAGALAGELSALFDEPSHRTFRAESTIAALRVPCDTNRLFIIRNGLEESIHRIRENRRVLFNTRLFGEMASFTAQREIARVMERREAAKGEYILNEGERRLYLLAEGEVALRSERFLIEIINIGDFWGEIAVTGGIAPICQAQALSDVTYFAIPAASLKEYPGVRLKLIEAFDRRMKVLRTKFGFEWQNFYRVGVSAIDDQHRELFGLIKALFEQTDPSGGSGAYRERLADLLSHVRSHFAEEESLLESRGYPRLATQREEHQKLLAQLEERVNEGDTALASRQSAESFFKDWLITHTLLEDRLFKDFMGSPPVDRNVHKE